MQSSLSNWQGQENSPRTPLGSSPASGSSGAAYQVSSSSGAQSMSVFHDSVPGGPSVGDPLARRTMGPRIGVGVGVAPLDRVHITRQTSFDFGGTAQPLTPGGSSSSSAAGQQQRVQAKMRTSIMSPSAAGTGASSGAPIASGGGGGGSGSVTHRERDRELSSPPPRHHYGGTDGMNGSGRSPSGSLAERPDLGSPSHSNSNAVAASGASASGSGAAPGHRKSASISQRALSPLRTRPVLPGSVATTPTTSPANAATAGHSPTSQGHAHGLHSPFSAAFSSSSSSNSTLVPSSAPSAATCLPHASGILVALHVGGQAFCTTPETLLRAGNWEREYAASMASTAAATAAVSSGSAELVSPAANHSPTGSGRGTSNPGSGEPSLLQWIAEDALHKHRDMEAISAVGAGVSGRPGPSSSLSGSPSHAAGLQNPKVRGLSSSVSDASPRTNPLLPSFASAAAASAAAAAAAASSAAAGASSPSHPGAGVLVSTVHHSTLSPLSGTGDVVASSSLLPFHAPTYSYHLDRSPAAYPLLLAYCRDGPGYLQKYLLSSAPPASSASIGADLSLLSSLRNEASFFSLHGLAALVQSVQTARAADSLLSEEDRFWANVVRTIDTMFPLDSYNGGQPTPRSHHADRDSAGSHGRREDTAGRAGAGSSAGSTTNDRLEVRGGGGGGGGGGGSGSAGGRPISPVSMMGPPASVVVPAPGSASTAVLPGCGFGSGLSGALSLPAAGGGTHLLHLQRNSNLQRNIGAMLRRLAFARDPMLRVCHATYRYTPEYEERLLEILHTTCTLCKRTIYYRPIGLREGRDTGCPVHPSGGVWDRKARMWTCCGSPDFRDSGCQNTGIHYTTWTFFNNDD